MNIEVSTREQLESNVNDILNNFFLTTLQTPILQESTIEDKQTTTMIRTIDYMNNNINQIYQVLEVIFQTLEIYSLALIILFSFTIITLCNCSKKSKKNIHVVEALPLPYSIEKSEMKV